MKLKWIVTLFAAIPFTAAMLVLQSCGGEGGPTSNSGGLPAVTAEFRALLSDEQKNASYIGSESCAQAACHGGATDGEGTVYEHWQNTAHAEEGVGCERCHGPGSVHAADPEAGNILSLPKASSPVVCGQCHGPIYDQHKQSPHYKLIASPIDSTFTSPGSSGRSSQCANCHGNLFKIAQENGNPISGMDDETIKQMVLDIKNHVPHIATCATCHNPHSQTGNLTDDGKEVQLRRKTFNTDTTPVGPGTLPSVFTAFDHSCAQCHNGRGADPSDAKLNSSTSRPNMHDSNQYNMLMGFAGFEGSGPVDRNTAHANAPGQCSKCHMPDSRHSFTVSFEACAPCHTVADAAARASTVKSEVLNELYALKQNMEDWAFATFGDVDMWEYTSNITAEGKTPPNQSLVPIQIKRARHNYYFVIRSGDYGVHNAPYAKHLINVANEEIDSLNVGRPLATRANVSQAEKLRVIEADRARANRADMNDLNN